MNLFYIIQIKLLVAKTSGHDSVKLHLINGRSICGGLLKKLEGILQNYTPMLLLGVLVEFGG